MRTATPLTRGENAFTALELLRLAAAHKGLQIRYAASRVASEAVQTYTLDDVALEALATRGIRRRPRSDCRGDIFTLVDENRQEEIPGWCPSNYWNFQRRNGYGSPFDLRISLHVELTISAEQRGVVLTPVTSGTFVSPCDRLPNFRMFQALVARSVTAPPVAREIAESDGSIVVHWADIGLGGIQSLSALFREFAEQKPEVFRLGGNAEILDPVPHPPYCGPHDALYVIEVAQPLVIRAWREQLQDYRQRLVA